MVLLLNWKLTFLQVTPQHCDKMADGIISVIGCTGQIYIENPEKDSFFVIRYRDQENFCLVSLIEGLRAKRVYIEFWPIFIFCRIELIFGRLTCFDMKSIVPLLFRSICASFSRNNVCRKTQFCVKRHLNERIFRRQILTRRELKQLLLAALTACFL